MLLTVEFHPEARDDFNSAIDWYNRERPDLGVRFVRAVEASVRRAANASDQGSSMGSDLRRVFVEAFPYSVVYSADPPQLFIVAVAHFRRHPDYWKHRR